MDIAFSLVLLTAVLLGSPGPVPLSLFLLGMTFGGGRPVAYLAGILAGLLGVMLLVQGVLTGTSFVLGDRVWILGIAASLYMAYIAIQMIRLPVHQPEQQAYCPGFIGGMTFNLVNPKAYAAFAAIFAQSDLQALGAYQTLFICLLVAAIVDGAWLLAGAKLRKRDANSRLLLWLRRAGGFALLLLIAVGQWQLLRA